MGNITQYALQVALLLAAIYLIYRWTLAGATFYRFNRCALLSGYAIAFIAIPLWNWLTMPSMDDSIESTRLIIDSEVAALTNNAAPIWPKVIAAIYIVGVLVAVFFTLRSIHRIYLIIHRGSKTKGNGYTLVLTDRPDLSPFSWSRYIVLPSGVRQEDMRLIVAHEQAHLRHYHWIDLALAQTALIFNWFNPAAYLMMKEMQDVHEYEADREVVKSGINEKEYQMLLLRNVTGSLFPLFADSLNHSQLKSRLRLMMCPVTNPLRRFSAVLILPAAFAVIIGLNTPLLASPLATIGGTSILSTDYNEVQYAVEGAVHSISYWQEGGLTSVSMDVEPGTTPSIYVNRHLATRGDLRKIKSEDVIFILCNDKDNRFVIKTK